MDFADHNLCTPVSDVATNRTAAQVMRLRGMLNISYGPDAHGVSNNNQTSNPFISLLVQAVQDRLIWDEAFYLKSGRSDCVPEVLQDGLIHFWKIGYARACPYKFKAQ